MAKRSNKTLVLKLLAVSVSTFVFGVFAMPPLYDKFCQITGIGQAGVRVSNVSPTPGHNGRKVKVLLDATANSAIPWEFEPLERSIDVPIGEPWETSYVVVNELDVASSGRAVYNVTPPEAARYFVKTECFCFTRQDLQANERREMAVRFYIDPDLPDDIGELNLSYTFFLNEDVAQVDVPVQPALPEKN